MKTRELIRPVPSEEPSPGQKAQIARRFGMLLHFGVNTFGNVEWSDGMIQALSYQPREIDAEGWVKTAWEAGMNYVVLVAKHHDGFCLWNSRHTGYCVRNSGNRTDVVRAVAAACEKYGLKLGLSYSLWDRSAPAYREDFSGKYIPYMLDQLAELLDGWYGEVAELWLDGFWDRPGADWRLELVYDLVKRLQPSCQIGVNHTMGTPGDRPVGQEERLLPQTSQEEDLLGRFPSDFRLWDSRMCREDDPKLYTLGGETYYLPFETALCSREGFSWFYSNIYERKPFLPAEETAAQCRALFAADNLAAINLPPDVNGRLVEGDVAHLMDIARRLGTARI